MASFSGQHEYFDSRGARVSAGPCQLTFDRETLAVAPAGGNPLTFDLGDVDSLSAADYEVTVRLYTGARVVLRAFGKAFQTLDRDLRAARRDRFVKCLLLSDLDERARYEGVVGLSVGDRADSGPAEIRLYESNIAVLPDASVGMQWRLADIDDVRFDTARYAFEIVAGRESLTVSKLGKRTEEFQLRLQQARDELAARSGRALLAMLPFLPPDHLARVAAVMKEGRTVPMADLVAVDSRIEAALLARAGSASHRPYVDALRRRAEPGSLRIGFKLLDAGRPGNESPEPEQDEPEMTGTAGSPVAQAGDDAGTGSEPGDSPVVFWMFARLATTRSAGRPGLLAWEATTGSGRATYFFRLSATAVAPGSATQAPVTPDEEVESFNRALVSLNFRREPIYLDDTALAQTARNRRYLIAARRLPELHRLRAAFAGRAIHASLDQWQAEVDSILSTN